VPSVSLSNSTFVFRVLLTIHSPMPPGLRSSLLD
jgi:hypothetical protein